ncbi:MAG TPA: hypothetical protein VNS79_10240 [Sphingobium sp.]|nr:hypothetical protein [Sphingobium sp.]
MSEDHDHKPIVIASERAREADEGTRSDGLLGMLLIGVGLAIVGIVIVTIIML